MSAFALETTAALSNSAATLTANTDRIGLVIGNASDTVMTVRLGGVASATVGIPIPAGTAIEFSGDTRCSNSVSIFCAGAAKTYTAYEFFK